MFTEHKDTLTYVADRIRDELGKDEAVVVIHGGIKRHDRRDIQDRFESTPTFVSSSQPTQPVKA